MIRNILAACGLILFLMHPHETKANSLTNGGFESPVQTTPGIFATFNIPNAIVPIPSTYITGWTVVQGNVDLTTTANYGPLTNTLDPGSKQDVDLTGDVSGFPAGVKGGGLSQTFATVLGQTYRLTFDYSHNPGTLSPTGNYVAQVTVVDAIAPANILLSDQVSQANGQVSQTTLRPPWVLFSQDFTATSDSTTLTFLETEGGFNAGIYLDDVSVDPVVASGTPLPGALPLFASGIGALGYLGLRRKRKAQAAA